MGHFRIAGLQQKYACVCWIDGMSKLGYSRNMPVYVEQNEMLKLGYSRNMPVYVEQNEMSKLGYNKERNEELQGQHKQLQRDIRTIQDKLDTLEAK